MKKKFLAAVAGIMTGLKHHSIRIQFVLALLAMIAGFVLRLEVMEWVAVSICIGAVIATEMLNTCIEKLCDMHTTSYNETIRDIKDIAAGAVLVTSLAAFVTALLILSRHIGG